MTPLTLAAGAILVVAGILGFALSGAASVTALIPSLVGVLLVLAGLIARNPRWYPHAIHGAFAVALLGLLGSVMNAVRIGEVFAGTAERPLAVILSAFMSVVLLVYLAIGVRFFVQARRRRAAQAA
jgi:hypothetical protein